MVRPPLFIFALAAIAACQQPQEVESECPVSYDYVLELPPEFAERDVIGIDSKVEEFASDDTIVSTDFGHYSAPPDCTASYQACRVEEDNIAGRDALVGVYRHGPDERPGETRPYRIWVHVKVAPQQRLNLNMFARCDTQAACDRALSYLRRVRIKERELSREAELPPPPPPAPHPPATPRPPR
jgi:hypothetical protein